MSKNRPNFFGTVLKAVACTRNRNLDETAYEQGVIQPAKKIREFMSQCGDQPPTTQQIQETLSMLKTIFETKLVEAHEQQTRFQEIIDRNSLQQMGLNFDVSTPMRADVGRELVYA